MAYIFGSEEFTAQQKFNPNTNIMKDQNYFQSGEARSGFAYISDSEIQTFFQSIIPSENISEHKYKRRRMSKAASTPEPGVVRKRGRPRKQPVELFVGQVA